MSHATLRISPHVHQVLARELGTYSVHALAKRAKTSSLTLESALTGGLLTEAAIARLEHFAARVCGCAICTPPPRATPCEEAAP